MLSDTEKEDLLAPFHALSWRAFALREAASFSLSLTQSHPTASLPPHRVQRKEGELLGSGGPLVFASLFGVVREFPMQTLRLTSLVSYRKSCRLTVLSPQPPWPVARKSKGQETNTVAGGVAQASCSSSCC